MAIWFCLVVIGWAYISLMTISAAHISNSILVLMGISGATGLAAVAMDATKSRPSASRRELEQLRRELDGTPETPGLRTQVLNARAALTLREAQTAAAIAAQQAGGNAAAPQAALAPVPANLAALEIELAEKEARLRRLAETANSAPRPATENRNWIKDILSDENGISFHRFQMFVWTVVLGVYFVVGIFKDYVMPEIDPQLLVLMGISSGTYLGFKFPEAPRE